MSYSSTILADSPTAYWRLGEPSGTNAADSTANANTGTYVNTPTLGVTGAIQGDTNTAATFALGSAQYVSTTTLGTLGSSMLTSSWEFWFKSTYTTDQRCIFGTINTGTTMVAVVYSNIAKELTYAAGKTTFQMRDNAGHELTGEITTNIYDGNWHHLVFVVTSATVMTVYVDNVSVAVTNAVTNAALTTFADFGFAMYLANRNLRGVGDLPMTGSLDEVAFYPTRLSAGQVAAHYAAATGGVPPFLQDKTQILTGRGLLKV